MYPSIIFEDKFLAVIEKGAGMVVNRAASAKGETLQDWVEKNIQYSELGEENKESDFVKRSGIVHRLDKETSGVILVAKNGDTFDELQKQFKKREVKKEYTILVHGHVGLDEGKIVAPVARLPWNRMRFGVVPEGRAAVTKYEVVERRMLSDKRGNFPVTLLKAYPETGRTHQLRVHFKHINHPVFADALYGGRKVSRWDRDMLPRQFLHASSIAFVHPSEGKKVMYRSHLPPDLVEITMSFQ